VLTKDETGRNYINLYYHYSWELLLILFINDELGVKTGEVFKELIPAIRSLLIGREVVVTVEMMGGVKELIGKITSYASPRKILKTIPGVKLVEMKHIRQDAPCCGGTGEMFFPGKGKDLKKMRMEEAKETGAEKLVTICAGCELSYLKWGGNKPFAITNIIPLLAKSLGIEREHALEPFFSSKDMEGVLEEFRNNIEASKYSKDDYRMTVGRFIGVQIICHN